MAKIIDFGNTWAKFFCQGEGHATHLARHPSPLHGKNQAKWHHLWKIFSACGLSSSFSPFTFKCLNSCFLETTFEIFLQRHNVQHSLQRVLSSYRQRSFHLPLHIYMAKISDFGNTWGKFFCRGETHAAHLARHPSPLHGKNRANWHHLQKNFFSTSVII